MTPHTSPGTSHLTPLTFLVQWGVKFLHTHHGAVVEGSAGLALAAARKMKDIIRGKTVCVLLCGGNIDPVRHQSLVSSSSGTK